MKKEPWTFQKALQKSGEIPTIGEIRIRLLSIPKPEEKFLLSLMYLTAGRVSEVLKCRKTDISLGVKRDREILLVRLKNLKSRKRLFKDIPIPIDREPDLTKFIMQYISSREGSLFNIKSRQKAWRVARKYNFSPHWLRHLRLTHLVTVYDFNDQLLKLFAGWSDTRYAKHYMELRVGDFLDKL